MLENGRDLLVVIMLEELDTRHLTQSLYALLKTTTYILWPVEEADAREMFLDSTEISSHGRLEHKLLRTGFIVSDT